MTHPDVLQAAAVIIYGERWKAPFARDLGVTPRQLYDWMEGRTPVPLRVWIALTLALATQARQAIGLLQQLEEIEAVEADDTIDGASVAGSAGEECTPGAATRTLCPWSDAHAQPTLEQPTG